MRVNPFLEPYNTPHDTVPFDRLTIEDYKPALLEGMRREDELLNRIIDNPDEPTFENTILPLVNGDDLLERVTTVMGNLVSACMTKPLVDLEEEMMPILTEHEHRFNYNIKLFRRVKAIYRARKKLGLQPDEMRLLKTFYEGFVNRGINLPKKKKEELKALRLELSQKQLQFSQNGIHEAKAYKVHITDEAQLSGMTALQLEQLAAEAREQEYKDGWLVTMNAASYSPLMSYCDNRELRRKVYMLHSKMGCRPRSKHNNLQLVGELVNLRTKIAQILGYKTYADMALRHRMAGNVTTVSNFIDELLKAYRPVARREIAEVYDIARETEGPTFRMRPWDTAYYSHKLQIRKYDYDQTKVRPYLELSKVTEGIFGLATKLYGITFKENPEIPVYHSDVKAYEVFDADGTYLAVLYADFFPRQNKRAGAWMTEFRTQHHDAEGNDIRPHVSIVMNLTKPTPDTPSLLSMGELGTFIHEFGHALHSMFSQCRFASQAGTNVYWDFVELPSQFMENFINEREFLHTFATHYKTGEPMPDDLIDRINASRTFNAGIACLRQLGFCLLDMGYYTRQTPFDEDVIAFEKRMFEPVRLLRSACTKTCMSTTFNHIMAGGYAAGYYCYKWAEVLDADAFELFQRKGIFNRDIATRFRREILSKGSTLPPSQLYRNYRHRKPSIKALLHRDGIKENA